MTVAALDNNEVAVRQRGQREDEYNNQIVLEYLGGKWALDNMTRGGGGGRKTSGWRTTRGDLAASYASPERLIRTSLTAIVQPQLSWGNDYGQSFVTTRLITLP